MTTDQQTTVRRPNRRPVGSGRERNRSFRIGDPLWLAGVAAAHKRGITLASVLRRAVQDLVDDVEANG